MIRLILLDLILLDKFQKTQDFFQDRYGLDCFKLANAIFGTLTMATAALIFLRIAESSYILAVAMASTLLSFTMLLFWGVAPHEKNVREWPSQGNSLAKKHYLRIIMWIVAVFASTSTLVKAAPGSPDAEYPGIATACAYILYVMMLLLVSAIYFVSCTPKSREQDMPEEIYPGSNN